jgi:hypothetical protein
MLNSFKEMHGGHKGHQSVPNTTSPYTSPITDIILEYLCDDSTKLYRLVESQLLIDHDPVCAKNILTN